MSNNRTWYEQTNWQRHAHVTEPPPDASDTPLFARCARCGGPVMARADGTEACARCGAVQDADDTRATRPEPMHPADYVLAEVCPCCGSTNVFNHEQGIEVGTGRSVKTGDGMQCNDCLHYYYPGDDANGCADDDTALLDGLRDAANFDDGVVDA